MPSFATFAEHGRWSSANIRNEPTEPATLQSYLETAQSPGRREGQVS